MAPFVRIAPLEWLFVVAIVDAVACAQHVKPRALGDIVADTADAAVRETHIHTARMTAAGLRLPAGGEALGRRSRGPALHGPADIGNAAEHGLGTMGRDWKARSAARARRGSGGRYELQTPSTKKFEIGETRRHLQQPAQFGLDGEGAPRMNKVMGQTIKWKPIRCTDAGHLHQRLNDPCGQPAGSLDFICAPTLYGLHHHVAASLLVGHARLCHIDS